MQISTFKHTDLRFKTKKNVIKSDKRYLILSWHTQLLTPISCISWIVNAIETPEPSSVLRPRNYNPHPYREGEYEHSNKVEDSIATNQIKYFENLFNQAPIQFPVNNPQATKGHPYAKLALKERQQKTQRFSGGDSDETAYNALARHAKKVLNNRLDDNDYNYYDDTNAAGTHLDKKHYAFSYTVRDKASGDDFSHTQQQVNGAVKGSYNVMLPDGRMQVVSYIADDNGYRAEVTYEGPGNGGGGHHATVAPAIVQAPVNPTYITHSTVAPSIVTPKPLYDDYNHYGNVISSTAAGYYQQPQILNVKIQSYNAAPHKHLLTKAVPSPAPEHGDDTGSTAIPLQIQSNLLDGPIVVTTPVPHYEDIEVSPRAYHQQKPANYYDYDYQQEYVPSIKYARSTDQRRRKTQ